MIVWLIVFLLSAFIVVYAMVGYPLLLKFLDKLLKPKPLEKIDDYEPTVTYMIVAHNEEAVIEKKLENAIQLDYSKEKMQILVASDNSTDSTNSIVESFIKKHPERNIVLYCSKEHKGKTNAQNEAQKKATGEILVLVIGTRKDCHISHKNRPFRALKACFDDFRYRVELSHFPHSLRDGYYVSAYMVTL